MSEEKKNLLSAFEGVKYESFDEAASRKKEEESNGRTDVNFFRIKDNGDYSVRIMPHSPAAIEAGATGYSQAIRQAWLSIFSADSDKPLAVKITDARQCNFDKDIYATYKYLAIGKLKEEVASAGNAIEKSKKEKLIATVDNSGFNKGLRFDYKHLMYVIDLKTRSEGVKLFECSNGLYKSIETSKMSVWKQLSESTQNTPCPISNPFNAYPVGITKSKNNNKVEYAVSITGIVKAPGLTEDEVKSLLELPPLSSNLVYDKRMFQATMIALKQYDDKYKLGVYELEEFKMVAKEIEDKLKENTSDTSSFSMTRKSDGATTDTASSNDEYETGILFDDLDEEYNELLANGVVERTAEMDAFKKKVRHYLKQEGITSIKSGRRNEVADIMDEIFDYISDNGERGVASDMEETSQPNIEEDVTEDEVEEEEEDVTEDEEEEEVAPAPRVRQARTRVRK